MTFGSTSVGLKRSDLRYGTAITLLCSGAVAAGTGGGARPVGGLVSELAVRGRDGGGGGGTERMRPELPRACCARPLGWETEASVPQSPSFVVTGATAIRVCADVQSLRPPG